MTRTVVTAERLISALDFARLLRVGSGALPSGLDTTLDDADIVAPREIPPDVVTMRSQVELRPEDTGVPQRVVLGYPEDAAAVPGHLSVLSPLGAGLLGLRVGDVVAWPVPGGALRRARIERLLHQPEATGDFRS